MTPVQITERELAGFYYHLLRFELQQLSDTEIKCCESIVIGCEE